MKEITLNISALALIATFTATAAVSKYSGIYNFKVEGPGILAITAGGRLLSLGNNSSIREELDPATSTVNSKGKIKGSSQEGASVTASISSKYTLSGTVKEGRQTARITGKRTFK